ncbi:MAG: hypothetical protein Q7K42_00230 [Candidatus Diapherotrites archaeon]|nr:hypothetical protein [Candidatus Diapherotrites archaeon]
MKKTLNFGNLRTAVRLSKKIRKPTANKIWKIAHKSGTPINAVKEIFDRRGKVAVWHSPYSATNIESIRKHGLVPHYPREYMPKLATFLDHFRPPHIKTPREGSVYFYPLKYKVKGLNGHESITWPTVRTLVDPKKTLVFDNRDLGRIIFMLNRITHLGNNARYKEISDVLKNEILGNYGNEILEKLEQIAKEYWKSAITLEDFLKYYENNPTWDSGAGTYVTHKKPTAPKKFPDFFLVPEVMIRGTVKNIKISLPTKENRQK